MGGWAIVSSATPLLNGQAFQCSISYSYPEGFGPVLSTLLGVIQGGCSVVGAGSSASSLILQSQNTDIAGIADGDNLIYTDVVNDYTGGITAGQMQSEIYNCIQGYNAAVSVGTLTNAVVGAISASSASGTPTTISIGAPMASSSQNISVPSTLSTIQGQISTLLTGSAPGSPAGQTGAVNWTGIAVAAAAVLVVGLFALHWANS
jgi:hypothetical protein